MTFRLAKKEIQFLVVTFPFFFLMGPYQVITLLATAWEVQWVIDGNHPLEFHRFPPSQIFDNFIGAPAIWLFTWAMYMGYRRGHFTAALTELIESIQESKQKPKLKNTPPQQP